MPRGKKQVPAADGEVSQEDNQRKATPPKVPLTDEQLQAQFGMHRAEYVMFLNTKKKADAYFKDACKRIKLEGGSIKSIKLAIELEEPGGKMAMQEVIHELHRIARWAGLPVGTQPSFFEEDRTPVVDRAKMDGRRAGLAGKPGTAPTSTGEVMQSWMAGWHEGQRVHLERFKAIEKMRAGVKTDENPEAVQAEDAARAEA